MLTSALKLVVAQRLIRKLCVHCRSLYLEPVLLPQSLWPRPLPHWKNNVCDRCYSGSYGRIALFEILPLDAALSRHIIEGATADDIEAFARANGMETLLIQGMRAVEDGLTTPEEIYRVLDVPHDK